jgi:hypothetical protein
MLVLDSNTISYYFRGDPAVVPGLQWVSWHNGASL